jgi:hypothetical protein
MKQEPELVARLAAFRVRVGDMLLDALAAAFLRDATFRREQCPHPLEDVKTTAQVLRVLTKEAWDTDDVKLVDACWRDAMRCDLFGDEFEAESTASGIT